MMGEKRRKTSSKLWRVCVAIENSENSAVDSNFTVDTAIKFAPVGSDDKSII